MKTEFYILCLHSCMTFLSFFPFIFDFIKEKWSQFGSRKNDVKFNMNYIEMSC